jgi:hypothetical protein
MTLIDLKENTVRQLRLGILSVAFLSFVGCGGCPHTVDPVSLSGVKVVSAEHKDLVRTDAHGHTTEQENIMERLKRDNSPGSIKHLYIISAYSGQVILYSTVRGKVTSSGKRLSPGKVGDAVLFNGSADTLAPISTVEIGGHRYRSDELPGDDGTYGSSIDYLYWFDSKNTYHQHYLGGGQIVHVSDEPIPVKSVIINMETVK